MKTVLEGAGATVGQATTVDQALDLLRERPADAIFTDIGLPAKDGYAFPRLLWEGGLEGASVPMDAVTAYARQEDRDSLRAAGFDAHIPKPIDVQVLIQTAVVLWKRRRIT